VEFVFNWPSESREQAGGLYRMEAISGDEVVLSIQKWRDRRQENI